MLDHVSVAVADLRTSADAYEQVLGALVSNASWTERRRLGSARTTLNSG